MVVAQSTVSSKPHDQSKGRGSFSHNSIVRHSFRTSKFHSNKLTCLFLGFWILLFAQNASAEYSVTNSTPVAIPVNSTQMTDAGDMIVGVVNGIFQTEPFRTILSYFEHSIGFVKVLIIILTLLIFNAIFLFIYVLANRAVKTYLRNRNEKLRIIYQSELAYFVASDDDQPFFSSNLKKRIYREIFVEELMSMHKSLIGDSALKVEALYFDRGFDRDSFRKIRSRSWSKKAKGFRELAQMNVKSAAKEILQYTRSKNRILRMEAQLAAVKLNSEDPLAFLHNLRIHLTKWEQINILNTIRVNNIEIESFDDLMDSRNPSVAIFAITLCGLFNHLMSWPKVIEQLNHSNPDIRNSAIKTLALFNLQENKQLLKDCFHAEGIESNNTNDGFLQEKNLNNKLAILDALSSMIMKEDCDFYINILQDKSEDFYVLKSAYNSYIQIEPSAAQILRNSLPEIQPKLEMLMEYFEYKNNAK